MKRQALYDLSHEPETTKEGEKVVCADASTGKILWENIHNVFLTDAPAERVGWSSVVGDPRPEDLRSGIVRRSEVH